MPATQKATSSIPRVTAVFDIRYLFFEVPPDDAGVSTRKAELCHVVQQFDGDASAIAVYPLEEGSYTAANRISSPSYQISQVQVRDIYALCIVAKRADSKTPTAFPGLTQSPGLIATRNVVTIDSPDFHCAASGDCEKSLSKFAGEFLPPNDSGGAPAFGSAAEGIGWFVRFRGTKPEWLLACDEQLQPSADALARIVGRDLIHILIPEVKIDYLYRSWREMRAAHRQVLDKLENHRSLPVLFQTDSSGETIAALAEFIQGVDLPFAETTTLLANGNGKVIAAGINVEEMREVFARFGFHPVPPSSNESIWLMPARHKADSLQADVRFVTERFERARSLLEIARVKATILTANESRLQTKASLQQAEEQRRQTLIAEEQEKILKTQAEEASKRIQKWNFVLTAIATSFTVSGFLQLFRGQNESLPIYAVSSIARTRQTVGRFLQSQTLWQFLTGVVILGCLVWLLGIIVGARQNRNRQRGDDRERSKETLINATK